MVSYAKCKKILCAKGRKENMTTKCKSCNIIFSEIATIKENIIDIDRDNNDLMKMFLELESRVKRIEKKLNPVPEEKK